MWIMVLMTKLKLLFVLLAMNLLFQCTVLTSAGWFTNTDLVEQILDTKDVFVDLHPGCDLLFAFDNSITRRARAPDGLDAHLLNLSDGGKNMKFRRVERMAD
jgi:hypothetical protein